jgi:C4-dicarboxylate transporter DctQ subunit
MDTNIKNKPAHKPNFFDKFIDVTRVIEEVILGTGVAFMAIILIANVFARTFFKSIYFVEELTQITVIFVTFGGIGYGGRKARHIRMGAIFDALNEKIQTVLIYIICGVSAILMFFLASKSITYIMRLIRFREMTPSLHIPYWITIVIVPIGFIMAGIQYIITIIKNIREGEVWLSAEQKSEYVDE